ncbi:MAG: flavin-dependent oxidoreductase [Actinomycetota bacterium]
MDARALRIVVVGGGIGGCAAALSLHDAGFDDVVVLEAAQEVGELGVGINVLPHAVRELTELGLAAELDAAAVATAELAYHNRFGQRIYAEPRGRTAGYRWPQYSIHRGRLLALLHTAVVDRLGADRYRTEQQVVGIEGTAPDGADVEISDRTSGRSHTENADLVVAADGVHSTIRAQLFPTEGGPLWNGVTMWRGVTEAEPFLSGATMIMAGTIERRMVVYPITRPDDDGQTLINWVAELRTDDGRPMPRQDWSATVDRDEVLSAFGDMRFDWLDVPALISGAREVLAYPMVDRDPLPRWTHGRVTLLGDAAHPMYPVGSNGASQAVIDGRVLAHALGTIDDVDGALATYEQERRAATGAIVLANRQVGPERCMELAAERAPEGFDDVHAVFTDAELDELSNGYKRVAGFDTATLNERPSLSISR